MKLNKGFGAIAVLLIIVGALIIGGGAYYMGKSSNALPKNVVENNLPQEEQNNVANNPVQNNVVNNVATNTETNCLPNTAPWIKVLSPNGGETYTAGQQITVNWKSCNLPKQTPAAGTRTIAIELSIPSGPTWPIAETTQDDGSQLVTLPTSLPNGSPLSYGNNFKIAVIRNDPSAQLPWLGDYSDNLFTINAKSVVSACLPTTAPWIKVLSPAGGEVYTVGQNVNVEWTSCNVDKVFVAWAQGGHDKGLLSGETPISANQGSYRWIVPHADPSLPNSGFWIAVEKAVPQQNNQWTSGILAKSGNFSIQ